MAEEDIPRNQEEETQMNPSSPKHKKKSLLNGSDSENDEDDSDDAFSENEDAHETENVIRKRRIQRIIKVRPPLTTSQIEKYKWHKLRYYPTKMEKFDLKKIAGITRLIYNQTMGMIKAEQLPFEGETIIEKVHAWRKEQQKRMERYNEANETQFTDSREFLQRPWYDKGCLKKYFITATSSWVQEHPYTLFAARETRFGAIKDCLTGLKAARTNQLRGNIQGFDKQFRTLKKQRAKGFCLRLTSNAINHYKPKGKCGVRIWPNNMKHWYTNEAGEKTHHVMRLAKESTKRLPKKFGNEFRIQKNSYGDYYLILLAPAKKNATCPETQGASAFHSRVKNLQRPLRVFGIDPGCRKRHVIYTNDGYIIQIGVQKSKRRMQKTLIGIDLCRSLRMQKRPHNQDRFVLSHQRRQRLHRKERKLYRKLDNLNREISLKTIRFLCANADIIILPPFDAHEMIRNGHSVLPRRVKRDLLAWNHGWFRARLEETISKKYPHVRHLIAPEGYTTITCSECGFLHHNIGTNETFLCPRCGFEADRDDNSGKCITLRAIRIFDEEVDEFIP